MLNIPRTVTSHHLLDVLVCDVQVAVSMVALKSIVGLIPTLCGLSSIVVVAPLATLLGILSKRVRKALIAKTDARVELITEVLSSTPLPSFVHAACAVDEPKVQYTCAMPESSHQSLGCG